MQESIVHGLLYNQCVERQEGGHGTNLALHVQEKSDRICHDRYGVHEA